MALPMAWVRLQLHQVQGNADAGAGARAPPWVDMSHTSTGVLMYGSPYGVGTTTVTSSPMKLRIRRGDPACWSVEPENDAKCPQYSVCITDTCIRTQL